MRIVIDLQGAQSVGSSNRGIGRYSMALAQAIVRNGREHEVHIALNGAFPDTIAPIKAAFEGILPADRFHVFNVLSPTAQNDQNNRTRRLVSELCREAFLAKLRPNIVHISSLIEGLGDDAVSSIGRFDTQIPTAVTLYDLIPLLHPTRYLADRTVANWYEERIEHLCRADVLLGISQSSVQEAVQHLGIDPARAVNVGAAADAIFRPSMGSDHISLLARYNLQRPFVMYTGGIDFRKNIEGLIRAYAALPVAVRDAHQLAIVCSCKGEDRVRLQDVMRQAGLPRDAVIMTGFVPDADLVGLYSSCKLFVFPSLHEGFGLPLLEAMQCGAPALGSNLSSIPEVLGLQEALFDPHDSTAMRDALLVALTDDGYRARLQAHGILQCKKFSWDKTAQRTIAAFEKVHRERQLIKLDARKTPERKLRMAYFSPIPPSNSGISSYSTELIPYLLKYYDIDVIVDSKLEKNDHFPISGVNFISLDELLNISISYDRVIFHFGNSHFHKYMIDAMQFCSGIVVLHDFYLNGMARFSASLDGGEAHWLKLLYNSHGAAAVFQYTESNNLDDIVWRYPCNISLITESIGVIVHSNYSRLLARYWCTSELADKIAHIPLLRSLPTPVDRAGARQRLGIAPDTRIVCSFGLMGPTKCNLEVLRSWMASTAFQDPNCRLVFVGGRGGDKYDVMINREIDEHGLGARVTITGWAEDAVFADYLAVCELAIQLRTSSRGESSLAVLDCLAHGIPTIVNANGSMAELPHNAAVILPDAFSAVQLRDAIDRLYRHGPEVALMQETARGYIAAEHLPVECAKLYHEHIERFYNQQPVLTDALEAYAGGLAFDEKIYLAEIAEASTSLAISQTIYIDISDMTIFGADYSEQRRILEAILRVFPQNWRLEFVRYMEDAGIYTLTNNKIRSFVDMGAFQFADDVVGFCAGDVILCFDSRHESIIERAKLFNDLRDRNVRLFFFIDDIRDKGVIGWPSDEISERYLGWLRIVASSDGAICTSHSVADELLTCLESSDIQEPSVLQIDWLRRATSNEQPADRATALIAMMSAMIGRRPPYRRWKNNYNATRTSSGMTTALA